MAFENLCMYCFEENGGADVCPHCGRDARAAVPQIQLLPGTLVYNDRFLIGRALGQDAGGIVYAALDTRKGVKIRIREYLPRDCARRLNSGEVVPEPGAEEQFDAGMNKLRASVEGVEDPAKRHFFFEENGTGYIAQRKASGATSVGGGDDDEGGRRGARMAMVVAIAALLVLGVAVGVIALVNYFTSSTDKRTDAPLTSGADIWQAPATPTPTPYAAATFAALSDPTHSWMDFTNPDLSGNASDFKKPTPAPTPEGEMDSINAKSDPEMIKKLQTLLSNLGWMDEANINSKYDDATKQAVKDFQQYMNDTYAIDPKLTVDGIAGKKTLTWLLKTDISMKPTPTPAPVTPSPTQAGRVIDENSSPEEIKYVQLQLANLGIMQKDQVDGKYGSATRTAVKTFQMRVNDILGYDAVNEDGVCDDRTLAYLDYYVEWWEENQPTPAPTLEPSAAPTKTPEPAPEYSGEVIDENSHKESIKRVQEMLITLKYLTGKADGVYGKQTAAAVSAFQEDIKENVDPKVQVTGKVDILTREYLEMYSAQVENNTDEPGMVAPVITVSGAQANEYGVYMVGDDGVKISWVCDGAEKYCVELTRMDGTLVNKEDSTPYTSLSMNKGNLSAVEAYRFSVTVLDKDGNRGAASHIELMAEGAADEAPAIPVPVITVTGSLSYADGVYRIGSEGADITWTAEGAEAYSVYIYDNTGEELYSSIATEETVYHLDAYYLVPGEKYTFTVAAIPEGGFESEGDSASVRLLLDIQATPEPTEAPATDFSAPVIAVDGALGEMEGVYYIGQEKATISWQAEGQVRAYSMYLTNSAGDTLSAISETDKQSMTVDPATMTADELYTVTVVAIPVNGYEEHGKSSLVRIQLYTGQTPTPTEEPLAEIGQVAITVTGHAADNGDTYYAGDKELEVAWHAEGNVKGYNVTFTDGEGNIIIDRELVSAESMTIKPEDMTEDVIYTMDVTAVPAGGDAEDGNSASVKLVRPSAPKLGDILITVTGHEAEDTGVYYIGSEPVAIEWASENAAAYSIYLSDSEGKVINSVENTAETRLTLGTDGMVYGEAYTFTVIAISPTGNAEDNLTASIYLTMANEPVVLGKLAITVNGHVDMDGDVYIVDETGAEVMWIAENAAAYNVAIIDSEGDVVKTTDGVTQTEMAVDTTVMTEGSVYALSITPVAETGETGEAGYVKLMLKKPEPTPEPRPEIGLPVITVTGHDGMEGDVYIVGASDVTVAWNAENADVYNVFVYGADNKVIISTENAEVLSMTVKPADMPKDEIVTVAVSGAAADGTEGESAYVKLMLVEPEITPEPTAEPTPEPIEVDKPIMKVIGYSDAADGVYLIEDGADVAVSWIAENAKTYNVAIYNGDGEIVKAADGTSQTGLTVDPSTMTPGEVYAIRVTPVGEDGTEGEYAQVLIMLVKEEPTAEPTAEPTEEPTPEPTAEPTPEPVQIGAASISVSGHTELNDNIYIVGDKDLYITWSAQGATAYDAVIYGAGGDVIKAAEGTTSTELTLKASSLPENEVLTLTVTGIGPDGSMGETASVQIARMEVIKPITPESEPEEIKTLQVQLYNLGWISAENAALVEQGTLDEITIQAILDFQTYIIEEELNPEIVLIDVTKPIVIDEVTITMLFDPEFPIQKPIE
ncbi:MAG: peptidoglycan-binding protein [Clostridia bacterium]|nr:peptidoglycan-binding protein [Clostridia bacterium]